MRFVSSVSSVEAEPFVLAGEDFVGVAVGGRAHAIPADVFRLFFSPESGAPAATGKESLLVQNSPKLAAAPKKGRPGTQPTAPAGPKACLGSPEMTTGKAVRLAVSEQPRTTAETVDRACVFMGWDERDGGARTKVSAVIAYQLKHGQLVKRDDPKTQLTHLYLVGGAE